MVFVIALCSCAESESPAEKSVNNETKQATKHMLSDQQRMIEKAKETEKLVKEADEKRRKALDDAGG